MTWMNFGIDAGIAFTPRTDARSKKKRRRMDSSSSLVEVLATVIMEMGQVDKDLELVNRRIKVLESTVSELKSEKSFWRRGYLRNER